MSDQPDPAAVEAAIPIACDTARLLSLCDVLEDDLPETGIFILGDAAAFRRVVASHAALQAERDALRETVANYREDRRLK